MSVKSLPAFHNTSLRSAIKIIREDAIGINECKNFKKKLLYLYYGMPNYRVRRDNIQYIDEVRPVAFIFDEEKLENIEDIHKIDSGTFFMIENGPDKISRFKEEFSLGLEVKKCKEYIKSVFGGNENYFDWELKSIQEKEVNVELKKMLEYQKKVDEINKERFQRKEKIIDGRAFSIEILLNNKLLLDSLLGIIFPIGQIDNIFTDELKKRNIAKIPYKYRPYQLNELIGVIRQEAVKFLKSRNLL